MKTITRRDVIRNVLKSFEHNYMRRAGEPSWNDRYPTKGEMYEDLKKLDLETCTSEDVTKVWGHLGWNSMPFCGHCQNRYQDMTYQIGEESDYESHTAFLCADCMGKMVNEYLAEQAVTH